MERLMINIISTPVPPFLKMIAVSSCLVGIHCRYDGGAKVNKVLKAMFDSGHAIAICPECMAGLSTPRPPTELKGGDGAAVLDGIAEAVQKDGKCVTEDFIKGAIATLDLIKRRGISKCVLKNKSPSCGCGLIYDGSFTGRCIYGDGVTTALLKRNGIAVLSADERL